MMKIEDHLIEDLENFIEIVDMIKREGSLSFSVNSVSMSENEPSCEILTGYDLLTKYYTAIMVEIGIILENNDCVFDNDLMDKNLIEMYNKLKRKLNE